MTRCAGFFFQQRKMSYFTADDGERIHVHIAGEGRPIVMLHGWTASHQEWFPFLENLTARHRVFRWDARGHGGHRLLRPTEATVARMARDLLNLLQHYNLHEVVAVGHSMGALTLWQYFEDFLGERLGKVCFIDQSPKLVTDNGWTHGIYGDFPQERSVAFLNELENDFPESVLRLGAHGLNGRARTKYLENAKGWEKSRLWLKALDPAPLIACWKSLAAADYRATLERIELPALLIYGGASNFYRTETAHYVRDKIAGAILQIYQDTDHSPHQWQRERFTRDLLEFIDQP